MLRRGSAPSGCVASSGVMKPKPLVRLNHLTVPALEDGVVTWGTFALHQGSSRRASHPSPCCARQSTKARMPRREQCGGETPFWVFFRRGEGGKGGVWRFLASCSGKGFSPLGHHSLNVTRVTQIQ